MKHYSSSSLLAPLLSLMQHTKLAQFRYVIQTRLFSAQIFIRLLSCYTFINRLPLPSTLHSCIRISTSLISLNNNFGTLTYAHGCFRLDYPPYHEQSEIQRWNIVIPRLTTNDRVFATPQLNDQKSYGNQCCTCYVVLLLESYLNMFRGVPAISLSDWSFTYITPLIE